MFSIFHLVTGLVGLYVAGRLILPLPWTTARKGLAAFVLLLVSQHHLVTRTFFGTLASPETPFWVIVFLGWLFGALALLAAFLLIKDLITLLLWLLRRLGLDWRLPFLPATWSGGLCLFALLLSAVGVWQAVRVPQVHTVEISLERLPPEFDGLRIVQLTDLHASKLFPAPWMQAVVEKANALRPDLVVITGDVVDGPPRVRAEDVAPLCDLRARLGVFAVLGNHEYYSDRAAWLKKFHELGLRLLMNEHVEFQSSGQTLVLAGITDPVASRYAEALPDIQSALAGTPKDAAVVLLQHQPRNALANAQSGVDLQLSGHTHGGQILGLRLVSQYVNEGFISGLYRVGAMQLYVSNGAGLWSGFLPRLGCPSEIAQIVLRAAPHAGR
jgi:predicted MPP superfamily phosphohydrolase